MYYEFRQNELSELYCYNVITYIIALKCKIKRIRKLLFIALVDRIDKIKNIVNRIGYLIVVMYHVI